MAAAAPQSIATRRSSTSVPVATAASEAALPAPPLTPPPRKSPRAASIPLALPFTRTWISPPIPLTLFSCHAPCCLSRVHPIPSHCIAVVPTTSRNHCYPRLCSIGPRLGRTNFACQRITVLACICTAVAITSPFQSAPIDGYCCIDLKRDCAHSHTTFHSQIFQ